MAGILYIVATPIGNLDDMPPRVAATFGAADFVAAEDTRVTMRLLNYLGLKKPMVSYYEHALQKGEAILQRIEAGESCALCSDAGMPCVSDPGEVIVRDALARGIKVVPVPAASACVTALAVSGQDTSRWVFEGFLPVIRKQNIERLADLLQEKRTVIFYEAPHKLRTTLDDLTNAFGADRSITLCRELTKLHEEIKKTTLGEAVAFYKDNDPRGEYVLVLAGTDPAAVERAAAPTLEAAVAAARALQEKGARNVLVSMAGNGALLVDEHGEVHRIGCPKGKVVNSVGAGDSMVAGFVAGYLRSGSYLEALRLGTACGSATAFSLGLAKKEKIDALLATS